ncbi:MAG: tetratricopeptide repeat protein [Acidobacteria bacterium]|nr:tetratricopeptide repeat protein [Acidobacteriota bacterium]
MQRLWIALITAWLAAAPAGGILEEARRARDAQDRTALEKTAAQLAAAAEKEPQNARSQYESALVHSYLAEISIEVRDQAAAHKAAEAGIVAGEKAVALDPNSGEYHRVLGALYGQVIPGNLALALRYGRKTLEEIDRAVALDPKNSEVYLSRGIGKYYLPPAFGGGTEAALADLRKAIELNPKSDQAHLWLGIVLRKGNRNREAREALAEALRLNPQRVWAQQQLAKTPAQ